MSNSDLLIMMSFLQTAMDIIYLFDNKTILFLIKVKNKFNKLSFQLYKNTNSYIEGFFEYFCIKY